MSKKNSKIHYQFFAFVRKEFSHVLRDTRTLLILFGMPVAQILIFGFALTNEVKNSRILVVDMAQDETSHELTNRIAASRYFDIEKASALPNDIDNTLKEGRIKMAVVFPAGFGNDLIHEKHATMQVIADATDPNTATALTNYITQITLAFQSDLDQTQSVPMRISPVVRMLYNPQLKGAPNFVPGVMALVLLLVCVMMTAISIVKEKETGTMEILLVSPFKPILVIFSKAIPYLVLSIVNVISILLLSVFVLDLPVNGSLVLLFAESILFIITCLSLGIFISVRTSSQQVAMLISLMGMLLPTILFSGFMFPIENMPVPLQVISNIVPSKWYYLIVKSIMIKGLGLQYIWKETLILAGITGFFLLVSLRSFKIRLA
jgi:ABC-2 type transport system permease protein